MKNLSCVTSLIIVCTTFFGCATIFQGSSKTMQFTSDPPDAIVTIDNNQIGKTPFSYPLKRKDNHLILFRKEGYKDRIINIQMEFQYGWLFLDIFAIYAWPVDLITGAWYDLDYDFVHGILE